ncbi:unnamed protein product, partial [Mesorhabditis spiculigera]
MSLLLNLVLSSGTGRLCLTQHLRHAAQLLLAVRRAFVDDDTVKHPGLSPASRRRHECRWLATGSVRCTSRTGHCGLLFDQGTTTTFCLRSSPTFHTLFAGLSILAEHQLDVDLDSLFAHRWPAILVANRMVEGAMSVLRLPVFPNPRLDPLLRFYRATFAGIPHSNIMRFPIHSLLPPQAREFLAHNETNLFYRLRSVDIHEHQMTVRAIVDNFFWTDESDPFATSNTSQFEMELKGDDRVTIWLEDTVLNELINQGLLVEWSFEWMSEKIPVTSPMIPADSRDFLQTLCTECYFLLNVSASGIPQIQATNESLAPRGSRTDRINLRVVNPDRNVTSVFVSFVLKIQAQLQPTLFNFLDLMRGMILDMLWPELKHAIEEVSYGKGLRVSQHCGWDPARSEIDIAEGAFSITTRLALNDLDLERCEREMKSAIPNTSKLFQKLNPTA